MSRYVVKRSTRAFRPWTDLWSRSGWLVQAHCTTGLARALDPFGRIAATGTTEECIAEAARNARPAGRRRAVVLLHGLGHHPGGVARIAGALAEAGWAVTNLGYASLRRPLAYHAAAAACAARALAEDGAACVDFVGHSLGGLVARAAIAQAAEQGWQPGRLLLIGSPARGAAMAKVMARFAHSRLVAGHAGHAVTTVGAAAVPLPRCRGVAVVAGGTGGRGFNPLLGGDNDGIVTVAETRMPECEDGFTLLRALHTPLAAHPGTVNAALGFLESGRLAA